MKQENELLNTKDQNETICILLNILESLCNNVMSDDIWELSFIYAIKKCKQMNISEEKIIEIINKLNQFRINRKSQNPLSSLF